MSKLNQEELLEELISMRTCLTLILNEERPENLQERMKTAGQAYQQIRELIKIFYAKEISKGPIKKDISQPDLIEWLQGINQAATAMKDHYVMKATTQLIEMIQRPEIDVLECVKKWLEIKAKNQKGINPACYSLLQIIPDIDHSWLLERLLNGEEPRLNPPDWRIKPTEVEKKRRKGMWNKPCAECYYCIPIGGGDGLCDYPRKIKEEKLVDLFDIEPNCPYGKIKRRNPNE